MRSPKYLNNNKVQIYLTDIDEKIEFEELPNTKIEFLNYWNNLFFQVPKEYQNTIKIELEKEIPYDECPYYTISLSYIREMTEDEITEKINEIKLEKEYEKEKELKKLQRMKEEINQLERKYSL